MSNTTQNITIEVCGHEMDATVNVCYEPGEPAVIHLLPEDCSEGSEETWHLSKLIVIYNKDDLRIRKFVDLSGLLNVQNIHDSILRNVKEAMIHGY